MRVHRFTSEILSIFEKETPSSSKLACFSCQLFPVTDWFFSRAAMIVRVRDRARIPAARRPRVFASPETETSGDAATKN